MQTFYLDYENGNDSNDGSDWANAWKTITSGATAARIAPGDVIRIAKSPDPVSIGNATWTNLSKTVTLASAQTATIDLCESAWTANGSGDTTVALTGVATDAKEGSYCMKLTFDSAVQTSIMQAYYQISDTDFSSYQKISFWIKNSGAITAGTLRIALCSDTAGATPVDYFDIPAIPSTSQWVPLTLTKSGGGNLGSSIQSIALYTDSAVTGLASKYIYVDDFIACTTSGLNLQSLISKNSLAQGGDEGWYGIQSINGTTVLLDNDNNRKANSGRGYYGDTETVGTYKRETIKIELSANYYNVKNSVQDSGTLAGGNIEFQGGYDTSTSSQDGETFFDGLNGYGYGIDYNNKSFITFDKINCTRFYYGVNLYGNFLSLTAQSLNNCFYGIYGNTSGFSNVILTNSHNNETALSLASSFYGIFSITSSNSNISYSIRFDDSATFNTATITNGANNGNYGFIFYGRCSDNTIKNSSFSNNGSASGSTSSNYRKNYLKNCLLSDTSEFSSFSSNSNARVQSRNHDQTANNHWVFTDGGTINSETNDRSGGAGLKWKYAITSSNRASNYPLDMVLMEIPCTGNKEVTVTAYCQKDHATNVGAKLVCRGGQLAGVASDVTDTKADDTDWEQLSISFTPTEAGVIEVEGWAYYVAGNSNVYFADVTVTEAA